jgi:hypothetical protein
VESVENEVASPRSGTYGSDPVPSSGESAANSIFEISGSLIAIAQAVACAAGVTYSLPSRSWIRPARRWRCTEMLIWFGRSLGHARQSSCRVLPVASARTRSPRLGALGLRPADLLAAALEGRPRPRLVGGAFASAATADLVLLVSGVLLKRLSTRSAVSRSFNRTVTVARSVSRRASRSLTFDFSALIWPNIVGVMAGMVAFIGFSRSG